MLYSLCSAVGTAISVVVAILAVGIVVAVVVMHFVRKKQGKSGCGCDCAHCGGCCSAHAAPKKKDNEG